MRIDRTTRTDQVLAELASRLTEYRLNRNESLETVALNAGISPRAVRTAMTTGRMTLTTLIRLLRAMGRLENLDSMLPAVGPNPLELARMMGRQRLRASRPRTRPPATDGT
jgi:putative transcriptional regulator